MRCHYSKPIAAFAMVCVMSIGIINTIFAQDKTNKNPGVQSGFAPVNGLKMYYEIHGSGKPLLLIHGSFMNIPTAFGSMIPELSKKRQVIAVELQGHGRTADIDRAFSYESMSDDIVGLLKYLKIDSTDVLGYSLGANIALLTAIRHPEVVRKLVIISGAYKSEGWYPETRAIFPMLSPQMFEHTPIKTQYDSLAPDPKHFADFINKMKQLEIKEYDFGADKIKSMKSPVLMIIGDSDGVQPEHAIEIFRLRGGGHMGDLGNMSNSQLVIFPATTHVGVMMHPDWLLQIVPPYLDGPVHTGM